MRAPASLLAITTALLMGAGSASRAQSVDGPRPHSQKADQSSEVNRDLVQDLYRQARWAINAAPAMIAPRLLADLARDEMRWFPRQGLEDYATAFEQARALPLNGEDAGADDSGLNASPSVLLIKEQTEGSAVRGLTQGGEYELALALSRRADVPKGPLYDSLIREAERRDRRQPGDGFAAVFSLVQECKRADGTYPYRGAAALLRSSGLDLLSRMQLARDGYRWAANQTNSAQINEAWIFLKAGHQAFPELDGELATAVQAMLQKLEQGSSGAMSGPPGAAQMAGDRLRQLQAELNGGDGGAEAATAEMHRELTFHFSKEVNEAAPADSTLAVGASQFVALVDQAEALRQRRPGEALALANQAAGMLDAEVLRAQTTTAARLAGVYEQLGANADAARLLDRCLDEADRQGRAADAQYWSAQPDQQAEMAQGFEAGQEMILEVYSLAARWALPTTAARAEKAPMVMLKPLILTRVALVAQVANRKLSRQ